MSRAGLALAVAASIGAGVACGSSPPGPAASEGPAGARAVVVAIADTGIDPSATLGGMLDVERSTSVVDGEPLDDLDGHGTEMATIVHAHAPAAQLVAIKASGLAGTSDDQLAEAIDHATDVGADVVLLAFSGAEPLPRTRAAIERAGRHGIVVVAAAGNDGLDLDEHAAYPAAYRAPRLVTVAAVDEDGTLLPSSNRGTSVGATGHGTGIDTCTLDGEATRASGTSPAAALVAAAAARHLADEQAPQQDLLDALSATPAAPSSAALRC